MCYVVSMWAKLANHLTHDNQQTVRWLQTTHLFIYLFVVDVGLNATHAP